MYQLGAAEGLGQFSSLTDAGTYIESKIAEFRALGPKMVTEMHQLAVIAATANANGDAQAYSDAKAQLTSLEQVYLDWGNASDKLDTIVSYIPGLGQIATIAAILGGSAAVVALAIAMYGIFRRESAASKALDALAQGTLTPAQAAQFAQDRSGGGIFGSLSGIAKAGAIVAVAALGFVVVRNVHLGKVSW